MYEMLTNHVVDIWNDAKIVDITGIPLIVNKESHLISYKSWQRRKSLIEQGQYYDDASHHISPSMDEKTNLPTQECKSTDFKALLSGFIEQDRKFAEQQRHFSNMDDPEPLLFETLPQSQASPLVINGHNNSFIPSSLELLRNVTNFTENLILTMTSIPLITNRQSYLINFKVWKAIKTNKNYDFDHEYIDNNNIIKAYPSLSSSDQDNITYRNENEQIAGELIAQTSSGYNENNDELDFNGDEQNSEQDSEGGEFDEKSNENDFNQSDDNYVSPRDYDNERISCGKS